MKYNEIENGFYSEQDDTAHQAEKLDTRRPRLSLEHVNKLRKMKEIKNFEQIQRKDLYDLIYSRPQAME